MRLSVKPPSNPGSPNHDGMWVARIEYGAGYAMEGISHSRILAVKYVCEGLGMMLFTNPSLIDVELEISKREEPKE